MAYLTAAKKAEIQKKFRGSNYNVDLLIDEVAAAVAAHLSANVAPLSQTISATPTQEEVQAISNKVDALIASLIAAGLMSAS